MYIARLQLKNFKSFGGSHDLPLSEGFTAIVGPNGSGKSNILDGLRWGLGDSNGGRLRITRQSDLLFQGTATRQPAKSTEIALELKDADVSTVIRRRFSDDSGAVTLVDGVKHRLQDLSEVKRRWRLDGDRFAFIGQGDVTDAITHRPMQRRNHLEELFGIDTYRKRRDDALNKILSAEDELGRLEALMAELESRRREIAPAVVKAKKARDIETALDESRADWYRLRRRDMESEIEDLSRKLVEERRRSEERLGWKLIWDTALNRLKEKSVQVERRRIESRQRLSNIDGVLETLGREVFELETALRVEEDRFSRLDISSSELREKEKKVSGELDSAKEDLLSVGNGFDDRRAELADLEARQEDILRKMEAHRSRREQLILRKEELRASIEAAKARSGALSGSDRERRTALKKLSCEIGELEKSIEKAKLIERDRRNDFKERSSSRLGANRKCSELGATIQPIRKEILRLEREQDSLSSAANDGLYPRPVNHVISAADLGRLTVRPTPVIESFQCPEDLTVAMDAALGGRQFWLLVESMEDAKEGLEELKRSKAGRATYLPLDRARPRTVGNVPLPEKGIVGWAIDLMSVMEVWRPALEHIFGDLLIVEGYEVGASLVSGGYRFPIVTVAGEVFSPGGTISGGQKRNSGGALKIRGRLHSVEISLDESRKKLRSLERSLEMAEVEEAKWAEEEKKASDLVSEAQTEVLRGEKVLADRIRDRDMLESEAAQTANRLESLDKEISEAESELLSVSEEISGLTAPEDETVRDRLNQLRPELKLWEERKTAASLRVGKLKSDLDEIKATLSKALSESLTLKEEIDRKGRRLSQLTSMVDAKKRERAEEKAALDDTESGGGRLGEALDRCYLRYQLALERADDGEKTVSWLEQKKDRVASRLEDLVESWESRYPYLPEGDTIEGDLDETERKVKRLENAMAVLGDFDRGALSEDQSLEDRIEYYREQTEDVSSGISELRSLVETTDLQAGELFGNALEKIDLRFNGLFQRLFGGGEAHLRLQEDGGLWDSGVDIVARPPGKGSAYLAQLSGGEQTLTALSLLFASMEVAHVPMVVLDEVDAALDEVNLGRFAGIVSDYAASLQILAMTHRRQTMERADVMYGVTMSEPGLSQIVGVRLEDWL